MVNLILLLVKAVCGVCWKSLTPSFPLRVLENPLLFGMPGGPGMDGGPGISVLAWAVSAVNPVAPGALTCKRMRDEEPIDVALLCGKAYWYLAALRNIYLNGSLGPSDLNLSFVARERVKYKGKCLSSITGHFKAVYHLVLLSFNLALLVSYANYMILSD